MRTRWNTLPRTFLHNNTHKHALKRGVCAWGVEGSLSVYRVSLSHTQIICNGFLGFYGLLHAGDRIGPSWLRMTTSVSTCSQSNLVATFWHKGLNPCNVWHRRSIHSTIWLRGAHLSPSSIIAHEECTRGSGWRVWLRVRSAKASTSALPTRWFPTMHGLPRPRKGAPCQRGGCHTYRISLPTSQLISGLKASQLS